MIRCPLANLALVAIFLPRPLEATTDPRRGAELVRLHVVNTRDVPARRLPGNAGHVQVLFERQTAHGLIGLIRLEIERGPVGLDELLRPDMVPELVYVLEGSTELEVPDSKAKPKLTAGDVLYRPSREARLNYNGNNRLPAQLLLWVLVPPPSAPLGPAEPMLRSIRTARQQSLPRGRGVTRVALDARIAPNAIASLELLTLHQGGAIFEQVNPLRAEIFFVTQGSGTLTIEGQDVVVMAGHAVYLPPGVAHSFTATSKGIFTALRSYVPPGPEERVEVGRKR